MNFHFWKMHGAGNDFILVDDRPEAFPDQDGGFIARLCERRRGIGAEGLLLIRPSASADFRMRFFNPDGTEADLCGNGARCIARLAFEIGAAPADMRIETAAGLVRAEVLPPQVRLHLPPAKDWRLDLSVLWKNRETPLHFVNSGVPHAVCVVERLASADVAEIAELNILHATMLAMRRAVQGLALIPQKVWIDGNRVPPDLGVEAEAVVKGDSKIIEISAASVLAKTARDAEMYALAERYPQYGFDKHKGYGTAAHLAALQQFGVLAEHRCDFAPVRNLLAQGRLFE